MKVIKNIIFFVKFCTILVFYERKAYLRSSSVSIRVRFRIHCNVEAPVRQRIDNAGAKRENDLVEFLFTYVQFYFFHRLRKTQKELIGVDLTAIEIVKFR